jgi:hypothetical protein
VLDNKMKVRIEAENSKEILRSIIDENNLDFEQMLYYAGYYKNSKLYAKIAELALGSN